MIVAPDFCDHWKTRMLVDLLGGDEVVPVYLLRLWAHCQNQKKDTFDLPTPALKAICHYHGKASEFEDALTQSGFVTRSDSGKLHVRGWSEVNASLIASWDNGLRGGRPPKKNNPVKTHGKPTGNPQATHGEPSANPDVTDREDKIEKRREDETELPFSSERFRETFAAFEVMRKGMGKNHPYTPHARKLILGKLGREHESVAVQMLENAIESGWKSVYPLNDRIGRKPQEAQQYFEVKLPGEEQ